MVEGYLDIQNVLVIPSSPAVGDTVTLKVSTKNIGSADYVKCHVYYTTPIGDKIYVIDETNNLSANGIWNLQKDFPMPGFSIKLHIQAFHYVGIYPLGSWNLDIEYTVDITLPCDIITDKHDISIGDTVTFTCITTLSGTATLYNSTSGTPVSIGTCTITDGKCSISKKFDTAGTYHFFFGIGTCNTVETEIIVTTPFSGFLPLSGYIRIIIIIGIITIFLYFFSPSIKKAISKYV